MKKLLACLLISAMALTALTACSTSQNAESDESDTSLNAENEQTTEDKGQNDTPPAVIVGKDGADGKDGKDGEKGDKGDKGATGSTGKKGDDGRSILSVQIIDGNLWITYSDAPNKPVNAGVVSEAFANAMGLGFYLLPDDTYAVNVGNAIFLEEIVIPESYNGKPVSRLLSGAFENCTKLKSVTVPNSVQIIEKNAFKGCTALESMTIPFVGEASDGTGETHLGYLFGATPNQNSDSIPASLKSITVTGGTTIGEKAFYNCSGITKISLADSITSIGENAFYGTKYYKTDTNWGNDILYIGNHLIQARDSVSGSYTVKNGTVSIADNAFFGCGKLTAVKLPDGFKSIGKNAFYNCKNLSSINIPASLSKIGELAFFACKQMTWSLSEKNQSYKNVDGSLYTMNGKTLVLYDTQSASDIFAIPTHVENIGAGAFAYCQSLSDITLPIGIKSIGKNAFYNCSVTEIVIPDRAVTIGDGAFFGASKLEKITVGNSVTDIGNNAFEGCANLNDITLGSSVTSIGYRAFANCSAIKSIIIPDSVKKIGVEAFSECSSLLSVSLGRNVDGIGNSAFNSCYKLAEVINHSTKIEIDKDLNNLGAIATYALQIHNGDSKITNKNGYLFYTVDTYSYLIDYCGTDTILTLPDSIDGNRYSIRNYAFSGNDRIVSVDLSSGVTYVGQYAFYHCYGIVSIVIGENVSSISTSAFEGCNKLVEVINNSDIDLSLGQTSNGHVAYYAFEIHGGNSRLTNENGYLFYSFGGTNYLLGYIGAQTELTLPESYNTEAYVIYDYAFYCNSSITRVTIPNGATSIGEYSFYNCDGLKSVTIGNGVSVINKSAFRDCDSLEQVNLGNRLTVIGKYAFESCISLTEITIPDSVTTIDRNAFEKCSSLAEITVGNGVTSIAQCAFYGCSSLTRATFKNVTGWYFASSADADTGTECDAKDLESSSTAAEYLKNRYYSYYWNRTV